MSRPHEGKRAKRRRRKAAAMLQWLQERGLLPHTVSLTPTGVSSVLVKPVSPPPTGSELARG